MTNYFNCAAQIADKQDLRYTADNQTAVIDLGLTLIAPYGSNDPFTIKAVAWGKVAEQVAKIEEGKVVMLEGQLNMLSVQRDGYKDTIASFKINKVITELPALINCNHIEVLGNVGGDVDSQYFEGGKNKASFTLAVRRTKDNPDWFKVELWGKTADTACQYVAKGSTVGVGGHLTLQSWTDKTTQNTRTKPVVVGDRLTLAGKRGDDDSGSGYDRQSNNTASQSESSLATQQKARATTTSAKPVGDYEDIPF